MVIIRRPRSKPVRSLQVRGGQVRGQSEPVGALRGWNLQHLTIASAHIGWQQHPPKQNADPDLSAMFLDAALDHALQSLVFDLSAEITLLGHSLEPFRAPSGAFSLTLFSLALFDRHAE